METKSNRSKFIIDAKGLTTRKLNEKVRELVRDGIDQIAIKNVMGQRYIAAGIKGLIQIDISGSPVTTLAFLWMDQKLLCMGTGRMLLETQ